MASKKFTASEWKKIFDLAEDSAEEFGLPARRSKSVVLGTFNIRKLGEVKKRSPGAWDFLAFLCRRFDFLAVQEVMDNLEGVRALKERMRPKTGLVISDVTGVFPGDRGNAERLAFLFDWSRVERTELASDITYDRSKVVQTLFDHRADFRASWDDHLRDLGEWEEKAERAESAGEKKPARPKIVLPRFLTFIRQPHCASFRVPGPNGATPYEFLAVYAHLLYGVNERERKWEFDALIEWLTLRAKQAGRTYHKNFLMMGDCNLEFEKAEAQREEVDQFLRDLNRKKLKSGKATKANFPLLTPHPVRGVLRTNARLNQTYDQIALFAHDKRLPGSEANKTAGENGADGYDYGVFRFVDLFAEALRGVPFGDLKKSERSYILARTEHDVSDHMPAWIRLPVPGA